MAEKHRNTGTSCIRTVCSEYLPSWRAQIWTSQEAMNEFFLFWFGLFLSFCCFLCFVFVSLVVLLFKQYIVIALTVMEAETTLFTYSLRRVILNLAADCAQGSALKMISWNGQEACKECKQSINTVLNWNHFVSTTESTTVINYCFSTVTASVAHSLKG